MYMHHDPIFSFVHAVILLAVSFFVLLVSRKADLQGIKTFGLVIAILLWVGAALVFGKGLTEHHQMFHKTHMNGCCKMDKTCGHFNEETQEGPEQPMPAK